MFRLKRWMRIIFNFIFVTPLLFLYLFFLIRKFRPNQKIWIFGNGPSLNDFDFSIVGKDDVVLVCNYFCLNDFAYNVDITFYCTSDPRLFENDKFLSQLEGLNIDCLVIPLRQAFNLRALRSNYSTVFYNYIPYFKLWEESLPFLNNGSLFLPLQSGDTVAFDVMVPLALSLRPRSIEFVGIDLDHSSGVRHSYDEKLAMGPRSSDEYLKGSWMDNTAKSLDVLLRKTQLARYLKRKVPRVGEHKSID